MEGLVAGLPSIGVALLTTGFSEAFTWYTTYRTTRWKGMKADLEKGAKKLEKMRTEQMTKSDPKLVKKIEKEEERLKGQVKELQQIKSKGMLVISLLTIFIMTTFRKRFAGVVVARLPFEPVSVFRNIAHTTIEGDDYYQCSFIFLYILCNMALRASVQKFMGFTNSRAVDNLSSAQMNKTVEKFAPAEPSKTK